MKFSKYCADKLYFWAINVFSYAVILLLFLAFKVDRSLVIFFTIFTIAIDTSLFLIDFFRKKSFYDDLLLNIAKLDKAYLVISTLQIPSFYEGKIVSEVLYDMGKSMNENIFNVQETIKDFKEYLELWIHEVKLPLASLELIAHNHKDLFDKTSLEQIRRIDRAVEQVLYYLRQETSEKDYIIKKVELQRLVNVVALKNKEDILESGINLVASNVKGAVYTDAKWLEFAINQIVNNAIKYRKTQEFSYIEIWTEKKEESLYLYIEDNGVGIKQEDLPRIFEKSFTGYNGRASSCSSGFGLYIVKNLLNKLGIGIEVSSIYGQYTRVKLSFPSNSFYEVTK